ncbi:hypothetical protein DER46DRAFT_654152 [Fusarium sp. MPI-SDFR-AT-0072]|uniref:Uncharacterized protein n=1 Tax=Fusarium oxysporum f. sp. rapae TaxID=485398 RepID=A0A8J5U423_FUSOX|nr:hypothetical protein Forpe1208_v001766 [Fusarium oxysporum f. sp. rapae]KAH7181994.1 hypothetical protein DER46DRAFT_654152 [Fusarium sp. MPI-SDFR-AT-0072]KAI7762072.1 hypothetical protein LZL87_004379 [Fusarium oxysporum]
MADKLTRGMWFNPTIIDDDQDVIKLEDIAPAAHTALLAFTSTTAHTAPPANSATGVTGAGASTRLI